MHGDHGPSADPWPQVHSGLDPFDASPTIEAFFATTPPKYERDNTFDLATTDDLIFAACRSVEDPDIPLAKRTLDLYSGLVRLLQARDYPHILRVWNTVENVNADLRGLERYRHFCAGRHDAFAALRPDLAERYPAASALGATQGGLNVYCLAARAPGTPVENPNQMSAFHYPAEYGPRSPSFSRALLKRWAAGTDLFISGTASITGHATQHVSDLTAQVGLALDNVEKVIEAAEQAADSPFAASSQRFFKAYIRHAKDFPTVRDIVTQRLGDGAQVMYLQADICRLDLLFEIEGTLST
jgi:chorismate lyase / 3-hydroxybenzoate synthase